MKFCCETFGYRLGAFHIDFIVVDGVPHFLEMGFRLSGMGVPSLVEETTGIDWVAVAFRLEAGGEMPTLRFAAPSRAVGQLRLRQPAQLRQAESWIAEHRQGALLPPLTFAGLQVSRRSSLYADLTRHAGILGTLRLSAGGRDDILAVFNSVVRTASRLSEGNLLCAE